MHDKIIKPRKKVKFGIFTLVMISMLLLAGCTTSKDEVIKVGGNEVPSLYSVVGEREIQESKKSTTTGLSTVELVYKAGVVKQEDLKAYTEHLLKNDWLITKDIEETEKGYSWQIGKESKREGNIVLIDIFWPELGSAKIVYREGEGSIVPYEEKEKIEETINDEGIKKETAKKY